MIILRNIVAAATSILLVLISTPAVVEGTCKCKEVCPNYVKYTDGTGFSLVTPIMPCGCWRSKKKCGAPKNLAACCNGAYCACNTFGCKCDPCGTCSSTRRMVDAEENEENCDDFNSFTSLSAEGKRNSLTEKYCLEEDQVVREDIYEVLRDYTMLQFEGDVFTCVMFNEAYFDVSHLTLCDNKHLGLPASNKKGKKQKKTP